MKCPESRHRENPAPLGKSSISAAQHRETSAPAALGELHGSLGAAAGEWREMQCWCPEAQAAECVSKASARADV